MEPMNWIKADLVRQGKTQKILALAITMDYDKLNRIINRFDPEPADFQERVRRAFALWAEQVKGVPRG
jgi:hypothetical protein